ncbi:hypothetical protein [Aliarcobacter butzleri]|uniref:hypothetical protein n=1 Tax=Aliarcobacter butzleri TaxID=28197 RepID=UPI00065A50F4|nr:hypothetical protein [Aliarcobacter butzleri]KLD96837.1 hypothetical protein AF74_09085 [Aliarcobacter butzleri L349]
MSESNKVLTKALEWVVEIDPPAIIASVKAEREKNPKASNKKLAEKSFSAARWKATSTGVVTGLPANPWAAVPAATADVAVTLRIEVLAVARVAIIYDENFFDDEDAKWELLIPIFGLNVGSQFSRELGIRGGMGVTRVAIKKYLSKETLKQFKKIMLKYFGIKVTQKGVITKTLPIVGGLIGGGWNYIEVGQIRKRTISYFEDKEI